MGRFVAFVGTLALLAGACDARSVVDVAAATTKTGKVKNFSGSADDEIVKFNHIVAAKAVSKAEKKATSLIPDNLRGPACILGGALAHLTFGSVYCWGNFQSYSPTNLRFFDGKEHPGVTPDAAFIMPAYFLGQCLAMPFGPLVVQRLGARATMFLGSYIMALAVFLSSFVNKLSLFMALYGALFGAGVGVAYTAPMIAGWAWMPKAKGLVSGAILTGFGAGGFLFSLIGTAMANPKKLDPVGGKFPPEVYAQFPIMLRKLALIFAALQTVGGLFVTEPPKIPAAKGKKVVEVPGVTVGAALKTTQFWLMWMMIVTSASAGLNVASMFKQFASIQPALKGDSYQAFVGGMGALFNGVGRLFWGSVSDKIGFKMSFTILTLLQALIQVFYNQSGSSKPTFMVANCLSYFCLAGTFAMMPPAIQRMFGPKNGALIYGVIYSAFGVASVGGSYLSKVGPLMMVDKQFLRFLPFLLSLTNRTHLPFPFPTQTLLASFGWDSIFRVLAGVSVFATLLTSSLAPLVSLPTSSV